MLGINPLLLRQFCVAVSSCLAVVSCGSAFAWMAPALIKLRENDSPLLMTSDESSWMVAIIEIGNLFSPIPTGFLADKWGRKPLILSTGPLCIISWILILYIKTLISICIARFIQGVALGIVYTLVPMYLGEIASQHIRGTITGIFLIAFYFGFLFEYIIGPFVSFDYLVYVNLIFPVSFMFIFAWHPESPHFYIMNGEEEKAKLSFMWLRGTTDQKDVSEEFSKLTQTVQTEIKSKANWRDVVATPENRRALLITQVLGFARIMSGFSAIISYATDIYGRTGFTLIPDYGMTIITGAVLFLSSFFSSALTDIAGRRPLLMISSIGSTVSVGVASVYFYCLYNTNLDVSGFSWICPTSILLYNLFLAFGLDPVTSTYRFELFPVNTRAVASSIFTINFTVCTFVTVKLYEVVLNAVGMYFVFTLFTISGFVGVIWVYFCAIETKNKSLVEIQEELSKKSGLC